LPIQKGVHNDFLESALFDWAYMPMLPPELTASLCALRHLRSGLGNDYGAKLGLRFKLPDDLKEVYLTFGIDLATHNGEGSWTLPMPGRFVVNQSGIVRAVDVDPDYQYRPEPQKTLDDVKALG
jgi:hypothetical protein